METISLQGAYKEILQLWIALVRLTVATAEYEC
jgi:hypothetical protein